LKKIDILGVMVDHVNMSEALERALACVRAPETGVVYTPNSEIVKPKSQMACLFSKRKSASKLFVSKI